MTENQDGTKNFTISDIEAFIHKIVKPTKTDMKVLEIVKSFRGYSEPARKLLMASSLSGIKWCRAKALAMAMTYGKVV